MLIDDYTTKVWLEHAETPTVEPFVRSLLAWKGHFGLGNTFMICTDQGFRLLSPFRLASIGPFVGLLMTILKEYSAMLTRVFRFKLSCILW